MKDQLSAHERRNAALRQLFLKKKVDLSIPRDIELHFWAWGADQALAIADSLSAMNFEVTWREPSGIKTDAQRWNIEARVRQSIDLTVRPEFVAALIELAYMHKGRFDGWGTSI